MDEDDDPSLLFNGNNMMYEDPCNLVKSLPPIYDKRFDMFRHKLLLLAAWVCDTDRIDLVEKLLKGGYVGVNEIVWLGSTLLRFVNSIKMAEFLINHGAVFKGKDFDCFIDYIKYPKPHMLNHFFNHPEFIYTDWYMDIAVDCDHKYMGYVIDYDNKPIIDILKRKRDRQHVVITMDELGKKYKTNVFTCLKIDEYL